MDSQDEQSVSSNEDEVISSSEGTVEGTPATDQPEGATPTESTSKAVDPLQLVDTLGLPDEQKKVLRDSILMQSDYTKKTQEIADVKKQWDQWQPIINYFSENPGILEQVLNPAQQQQDQPQEPEIPDDPKEFYNSVLSRAKSEAVAEAIQLMEQKQARQQDIMSASAVDPRLADDNFGRIIASLVEADPDVKSGRKSFTEATKSAVAFYDSYANTMESKIKADITQKAQSKTMVTPKMSSPATTTQKTALTMHEAYKQTLEELGA